MHAQTMILSGKKEINLLINTCEDDIGIRFALSQDANIGFYQFLGFNNVYSHHTLQHKKKINNRKNFHDIYDFNDVIVLSIQLIQKLHQMIIKYVQVVTVLTPSK